MNLTGGGILSHIEAEFAREPHQFPRSGNISYPVVMRGWIEGLNSGVLKTVTSGAIALDGGHLTMHDREHVERVVVLASDLIGDIRCNLEPYELVLLLCAIYMHDLGNALGRVRHEENIASVLSIVGNPVGFDGVEIRSARQIAGVHGGTIAGSRDTISTLPLETYVFGKPIRPRLLAALLRLADELADDPARANQLQLRAGVLPVGAEAYHLYATHLHTQRPEGRTGTIHLMMDYGDPSLFKAKVGKREHQVFLLDEIFERTRKTYQEARYCSRFLRPHLDFERVSVVITIFDGDGPKIEEIRYTLEEVGYAPEGQTVYTLAPELNVYRGNGKLTAEALAKQLGPQPTDERRAQS